MILNIILIIAGIALVLWGADRLTDGAVAVAQRLGVPQIVIGLTIVAFGTSMPEFCSSLVSALNHQPAWPWVMSLGRTSSTLCSS